MGPHLVGGKTNRPHHGHIHTSAFVSDSYPGPLPHAVEAEEVPDVLTVLCDALCPGHKCSLLPLPDSSGSKHSPDLLDSSPEAQRKLRQEAVIWRIQPHLRQLSEQICYGKRRDPEPGDLFLILALPLTCCVTLSKSLLLSGLRSSSLYPLFISSTSVYQMGPGPCACHARSMKRTTMED